MLRSGDAFEVALPVVDLSGRRADEDVQPGRRGDPGQVRLAGPSGAVHLRPQQRLGPVGHARDRRGDHTERGVGGVAAVDHEVRVAVAPPGDRLGPVPARDREAERTQQRRDAGRVRHLEERRVHRGGDRGSGPQAEPVLQEEQGAHRVAGGAGRVGLAYDVAEHLERHRPAVAGVEGGGDDPGDVEGPLAGEAAEVPAPLEHVHVQQRGVGHLEEPDPVTRYAGQQLGQGGAVVAAGEQVEGVDGQRHGRVVGAAYGFPGLGDPVDVPSPGQRLVGDRDAVLGREGAELVQLLRGQVEVVDRVRRRRWSRPAPWGHRAPRPPTAWRGTGAAPRRSARARRPRRRGPVGTGRRPGRGRRTAAPPRAG